jgi:hypothetical protein
MKEIHIEKTNSTPFISAKLNGEITIEGISIPENVVDFYEPLNKWVNNFKLSPSKTVVCNIKLIYLNTVTAIIIANLFKSLKELHPAKSEVTINWFYEKNDYEIQETGKDLKSLVNVNFNVLEY